MSGQKRLVPTTYLYQYRSNEVSLARVSTVRSTKYSHDHKEIQDFQAYSAF